MCGRQAPNESEQQSDERQPATISHHTCDQRTWPCAERQSNAQLPCPQRDGIPHHPGESSGSEHQGQARERCQYVRTQPLTSGSAADQRRQRRGVEEREICVQAAGKRPEIPHPCHRRAHVGGTSTDVKWSDVPNSGR